MIKKPYCRVRLSLAEANPAILLDRVEQALESALSHLVMEWVGPGLLLNDTALMLFDVLQRRPVGLHVHAHSHSCLIDGAILPWLAADSRSLRTDGWIELSHLPERPFCAPLGRGFPDAILRADEPPAETDFRLVCRHLNAYLPVAEIAGQRLFPAALEEWGLLSDGSAPDSLAPLFLAPIDPGSHPSR
jgi:hypothetical protein